MDYIISITNKCNLHCRYCYEKKLNTELGNIDDETADRIIEFITGRNDANIVYFFGGEPLLYKDTIKKLALAVKANQYVITTNGMLIDEEFAKWCSEHGIVMNVSHDGADCSARGIKAEDLNEKIRILQKYQRDTMLQLVYTEETLPMLSENLQYFRSLGINKVSAVMDAGLVPKDIDRFGDVLRESWAKAAEVKGMHILEIDQKINKIRDRKKDKCEICKKKMYINWDGKIYPCMQFQNNAEFRCGDVFSGLDVSKTERDHPDYSILSERCADCEIAEYCNNSCACRKMSTSGTLRDISEAGCLEEQVLILTALERINRIQTKEQGEKKK